MVRPIPYAPRQAADREKVTDLLGTSSKHPAWPRARRAAAAYARARGRAAQLVERSAATGPVGMQPDHVVISEELTAPVGLQQLPEPRGACDER